MKKILTLMLILTMAISFASCGSKETSSIDDDTKVTEQEEKNKEADELVDEDIKDEGVKETDKDSDTKTEPDKETKPQTAPQTKPQSQPQTESASKPEAVPETKPETKPSEDSNKSVGNTLLADFKAKASSASSALSLAEALVANPIIEFAGAAMSVEEGYLTGFGNAEIKGFKEGAMFAPMIGTIPFVGYVFTLDSAENAAAFTATLKKHADKRWNICTEADEMITGSEGNKVFFVMSPLSFEE